MITIEMLPSAEEDIYYESLLYLFNTQGSCYAFDCDDCPIYEMYHSNENKEDLNIFRYRLALKYAFSKGYITEEDYFNAML